MCKARLTLVCTGLTVAGHTIGSWIDGEPPVQPESLTRAGKLYGGRAMEVTTHDGQTVTGARETSRHLERADLRKLYLDLAGPDSPRLPLPGDTIRLTTGSVARWVRLEEYVERNQGHGATLLDTTSVGVRIVDLPESAPPTPIPWSAIDRIQWNDGSRLENPRLALPLLARIPVNPHIFTLRTEEGIRGPFRSWEVERIVTVHQRKATTIGTLSGLGADFHLLYLFGRSLDGAFGG